MQQCLTGVHRGEPEDGGKGQKTENNDRRADSVIQPIN